MMVMDIWSICWLECSNGYRLCFWKAMSYSSSCINLNCRFSHPTVPRRSYGRIVTLLLVLRGLHYRRGERTRISPYGVWFDNWSFLGLSDAAGSDLQLRSLGILNRQLAMGLRRIFNDKQHEITFDESGRATRATFVKEYGKIIQAAQPHGHMWCHETGELGCKALCGHNSNKLLLWDDTVIG